MIFTTTNTIEGHKIHDYLGIVTGISVNAQRAKFTLSAEKYLKAIGKSIELIKEEAFQDLRTNALNLKANAVVGIKIDIELTATNYVTVSITGTAVKVA